MVVLVVVAAEAEAVAVVVVSMEGTKVKDSAAAVTQAVEVVMEAVEVVDLAEAVLAVLVPVPEAVNSARDEVTAVAVQEAVEVGVVLDLEAVAAVVAEAVDLDPADEMAIWTVLATITDSFRTP